MLHMCKERKRKTERTIANNTEYLVFETISFDLRTFSETFCKTDMFAFLFVRRSRFILFAPLKFLNRDLTCLIVNTITDFRSNFVTLCKT